MMLTVTFDILNHITVGAIGECEGMTETAEPPSSHEDVHWS